MNYIDDKEAIELLHKAGCTVLLQKIIEVRNGHEALFSLNLGGSSQ